jgi:hypothetical protein
MNVTHDDCSDVIAAVQTAQESPERRRASRIKRKIATQMTAWEVGRAPEAFGVVIEDISETGVGIIHSEALAVGGKYLLTVPRALTKPVIVECTVARCQKSGQRTWNIGLAACDRIDDPRLSRKALRLTSTRTRLLFVLFGLTGLAVALFVPL